VPVNYSLSCSPSANLQLKVGPTGHYLVNAAGIPFQLRCDTPWSLIVQLTREETVRYFGKRRSHGFNAALLQLVNVDDGFADNAPANAYGELPFVGGDFTVRNSAYWSHVDFVLRTAAEFGFIVIASALYLGFNGGSEGWYSEAVSQGTSDVQNYGAFLGARYAGYDNIIWCNGGDYRPPTLAIPNALATGILGADSRHLVTTHWARNSTGTDGSPSWLTLNSSYTSDDNISSRVLADYQAAPTLPTFLIEARYEGDNTFVSPPVKTPKDVRVEAWQALLSGACGHCYGHHVVWPLDSGWEAALDAGGSISLSRMHALFESIAWWKLAPDASSALVTAGRGTSGTTSYVTAGLASDGTVAVVYTPTGSSFTVDLSQMVGTGNVTATWVDPYSGTRVAATGSPLAQSSHAFVASSERGNNSNGDADWALLLEAS